MYKIRKGFTLVELIVVLAIVSVMLMVGATVGIPTYNKAKSNSFGEELNLVSASALTAYSSGGSPVHAIKVMDLRDDIGNLILKDYIWEIPPSKTFTEVLTGDIIEDAIDVDFGVNTAEINGGTYTMRYKHLGTAYREEPYQESGTVPMPNTSKSAAGIAPLFTESDSSLHEDFIMSSRGLDLGDFKTMIGVTDSEVLEVFFGSENHPGMIGLTMADIDTISSYEQNAGLKTVNNPSRGRLYFVTSLVSKSEFAEYVDTEDALGGVDEDLAKDIYERVVSGFNMDTPVYIPNRFRDVIKSAESDLKTGYYR